MNKLRVSNRVRSASGIIREQSRTIDRLSETLSIHQDYLCVLVKLSKPNYGIDRGESSKELEYDLEYAADFIEKAHRQEEAESVASGYESKADVWKEFKDNSL